MTSEREDAVSEDVDHETQKDSEKESDDELQKNKFNQKDTKFEKTLKQKNEILESL